jgi:cholesterol oxidase
MASFDYDVVIIGSGFGGSVAALRAAEKGYRVGVMEAGRRWKDEDIPKTRWDLPHFLWQPRQRCTGSKGSSTSTMCSSFPAQAWAMARMSMATRCMSLRSSSSTRRNGQALPTGPDELAPCIDQATRMLGVVRYPYMPTDVDRYMQQVAIDMGRRESFNKAPVGVYFGSPGVEADDPATRL